MREAQIRARHATPNLTMNTYARAHSEHLAEVEEAVGQLNRSTKAQRGKVLAPSYARTQSRVVEAAGIEPLQGSGPNWLTTHEFRHAQSIPRRSRRSSVSPAVPSSALPWTPVVEAFWRRDPALPEPETPNTGASPRQVRLRF